MVQRRELNQCWAFIAQSRSFYNPPFPSPSMAYGREWRFKWAIKHCWKTPPCSERSSEALRRMDAGAVRAQERQCLIFMGLLNSHVLRTYESGDVSPSHQLGTLYLHLLKSCSLPSVAGGTEPDSSIWATLLELRFPPEMLSFITKDEELFPFPFSPFLLLYIPTFLPSFLPPSFLLPLKIYFQNIS